MQSFSEFKCNTVVCHCVLQITVGTFRCVLAAKLSEFDASLEWGKRTLASLDAIPRPMSIFAVVCASKLYETLVLQGQVPRLGRLRAILLQEAKVSTQSVACFTSVSGHWHANIPFELRLFIVFLSLWEQIRWSG